MLSRPGVLLVSLLFSLIWSHSTWATVILQYHHISDSTPPSTSISPALFQKHMQHLLDKGYQVLALHEVAARLQQGESLPDQSVVITFDDGYDSVYTEAYPFLLASRTSKP